MHQDSFKHIRTPIKTMLTKKLTFQDGELDLKWVKVQYVEQHCFVHDTNNPYL